MERVTGIGGIFFKSEDPEKLQKWYCDNLGLPAEGGYVMFPWREHDQPERPGQTVWTPFKKDTKYFDPTRASFMVNYRVRDLDAMLAQLRAQGCQVDERVEDSEYGKFGWATDPEGNRFELWQPPEPKP